MAAENACTNKSKTSFTNSYTYINISHLFYVFIISGTFSVLVHHLRHNNSDITLIFLSTLVVAVLHVSTVTLRSTRVYLLDFSCYKHDPSFSVSTETILEKMSASLSPESLTFTRRVLEKSGVSDTTFVYGINNNDYSRKFSIDLSRGEAEVVTFGAVDDLMMKTGVDPREIGVVIVNVSTFNPVPSLSAMIVNRYKLREDVLSYNLGGMGCSAGLIAVDLAKHLLKEKRNTYALIMSLECPSAGPNYNGDDKSKLLCNCLFRMGGAAVLLSNRPTDRSSSKYELTHTIRTHLGADDRAYYCIFQEPDEEGRLGMSLSKDLMAVAGDSLKANITALSPLVLPLSEKLRFLATWIGRRVLKMKGIAPYVPNFMTAFEHFCIHAGGKAVLDAMEKNLKLSEWDMEPSRMTLHRYCNTSSSSLWYELAYAEAKGRVKKGDRIWQIGFGSGFKCVSGVWRALRTINPEEEDNPWTEVIHDYPVQLLD